MLSEIGKRKSSLPDLEDQKTGKTTQELRSRSSPVVNQIYARTLEEISFIDRTAMTTPLSHDLKKKQK